MQILKGAWNGMEVSITYTRGTDEFSITSLDRPTDAFRQAWRELRPILAGLFDLTDPTDLMVREARFAYTDSGNFQKVTLVSELSGSVIERKLTAKVPFVGDQAWHDSRLEAALTELRAQCIEYAEGVREQATLPGMGPAATAAVRTLKDTLDAHGATMTINLPDPLAGTSEDGSEDADLPHPEPVGAGY